MRTLTVDSPIVGDLVELGEQNAHYVGRVLRLAAGTEVRVIDSEGAVWSATLDFPDGRACLSTPTRLPSGQGAAPLLLLTALLKGPRFEYTLEKATELGVDVIVPFSAQRSVVQIPAGKRASKQARWQRICDSAIRQCARPGRALVTEPTTLADAISLAGKDGAKLLALNERDPEAKWPADLTGPLALVIGPEGGFVDAEVETLRAPGASFAGLGPTVVRAETAAAAAVTVVRMVRSGLLTP